MQKYGPPQRIDKIDGHEFWTYVLDLGVQSNSFGTSFSSGFAAGFSPASGTAQAFGSTSGFGSSSSFSQPVRDEFTYEIDKSGDCRSISVLDPETITASVGLLITNRVYEV